MQQLAGKVILLGADFSQCINSKEKKRELQVGKHSQPVYLDSVQHSSQNLSGSSF